MEDYIRRRVVEEAQYAITQKATVRQTAQEFGLSKSTIHVDLTERLMFVNPQLGKDVRNVIEFNKAVRHLRGGEATKNKKRREKEHITLLKTANSRKTTKKKGHEK